MGRVITISPDARYLAYLDGGAVRIYDMQTRESFTLPNIGTNVVISGGPDYKLAYAYGESYGNTDQPQLLVYDLTTRTLIFQIDNPATFGAEIAFNRDGSRIASLGDDIRIISTQPRPRWVVPTNGASSGDVAYRPVPANQSEQVAFGAGKAIKLFDLARGTGRLFPITASSTAGRIKFSPDGRLMAAVGEELEGDPFSGEPRFNLFDVDTGNLLLDTGDYRGGFAFSPDGTLLVVSDGNTRILGVVS
jgi:WD40 repeat protein